MPARPATKDAVGKPVEGSVLLVPQPADLQVTGLVPLLHQRWREGAGAELLDEDGQDVVHARRRR